jgi:hypothetical protein
MHDEQQSLTADSQAENGEQPSAASNAPAVCPAKAVVDAEALQVAKAALVGACEYFPWVGPLLESIAFGAKPGVIFATCWGGTSTGIEPLRNPERHAAYVAHMERTTLDVCPWLLPLLDAAGATVIAGPGVFVFMVPHRYGTAHDIPQLQPFTYLLPWAEPDEVIQ